MAAEKIFENRIKEFLKEQGCWHIKYWGGAAYTKAGIPDILACCNGSFLGIEVKAERGKPSELQLYNLRKIDEAGGFAILLYPEAYTLFQMFIRCIKCGYKRDVNNYYRELKTRWQRFENINKDKGV